MMKLCIFALGVFLGLKASGADLSAVAWSPAVLGLRGHLAIELTHDPDPTEPTYRVLLVLDNEGVIGNLGKISQTLWLDFGALKLRLKVQDDQGNLLPDVGLTMGGNRMSENYRLTLPPDAVLSFPMARGGNSPPHDLIGTSPTGRFLQQDEAFSCWVIPPAHAHKYFLSGRINCERRPHATIEERRRETPHAWQGTLVLPALELPQN